MHLKVTRANTRKYQPTHTASGQCEYEVWMVIEKETGKQIGTMHLWGLTEKEANELGLTKEITTE